MKGRGQIFEKQEKAEMMSRSYLQREKQNSQRKRGDQENSKCSRLLEGSEDRRTFLPRNWLLIILKRI